MLAVGDDGGDLAAFRRDLILRLGQSPRVDPAVRAPMAAMERDGDGSLLQQPVEAHELTGLIGQYKIRHRLARLRRIFADIVLLQPRYEVIDRDLKMGTEPPNRIGEGLQSLGQRRVHVPALDEGVVKLLRERFRGHSTLPGRGGSTLGRMR
jgi:hypothetical protein